MSMITARSHPGVAARAFAGALALAMLAGCATRITPPRSPVEPRPVFVLDHGRHASLVLSLPGGRLVRYSYGDWEWYALARVGPAEGSRATLFETQAALGRRELAGGADEAGVRRAVAVPAEAVHTIRVEGERVEQLRRELDAMFESNRATLLYSALYDLEFVHHPRRYSLGHNSNYVVAGWLTALGCDVRGGTILSNWRVESRQ